MAATQHPAAELAVSEPSGPPAWKTLPSWTVVATGDKAAGADVIRSMAERAGADIVEVEGSHVIMISQPQAVTDQILKAVGAAVPGMTTSQGSADELTEKLQRTELQHKASSIPGREIVQVLTEIPAGVESGWHQHPGEEVGYILAGTVEIRIKDQPTLTLRAGDPFLMPPRTPHNALDLGPETEMMLSTYIVEAEEPLATFTDEPESSIDSTS